MNMQPVTMQATAICCRCPRVGYDLNPIAAYQAVTEHRLDYIRERKDSLLPTSHNQKGKNKFG